MSYQIVNPQPPLRDFSVPYDIAAPGLYSNEALILLNSNYIAISVEAEWIENNFGVVLKASARWCDETGETVTTSTGAHVEVGFNHTLPITEVTAYSLEALKKDALLLLLNEPALIMREETDIPVIDLNDDAKLSINIAQAITNIKEMEASAGALSLLG